MKQIKNFLMLVLYPSAIGFVAELPGSGGVYPLPKIESVQLYRYEKPFDYFIMSCEVSDQSSCTCNFFKWSMVKN